MSEPIGEVNEADFSARVIERSRELPVLVDFWAPWCAPCRMLTPILARIAGEYAGRMELVGVNIDENPDLARTYRVQSIPLVQLYRDGAIVEEFLGVQPEGVIRALMGRHIERASDRAREAARAALARGDTKHAEALLREALAADPDNDRMPPDLAGLLIGTGRYDEADEVLDGLPARRALDEDIAALRARIKYGRLAAQAPSEERLRQAIAADPGDCEARYRLAARLIMEHSFEAALEQLLEIVRRDRAFGDDAARKAMLEVFALMGGEGPIVKRYRTLLSSLLY
ncbi:MAG: tetratricopeptide repeat protein [Gammaproteobacteria bacterium]